MKTEVFKFSQGRIEKNSLIALNDNQTIRKYIIYFFVKISGSSPVPSVNL